MSKEHFEPVTAKSLAKDISITMSLGTYYADHIEAILEPHIRKPSDEDKSVPQRCEEAYNEAIQLLREWDKYGITSVQNRTNTEAFLSKPNPFKEAEIVDKEEDKTVAPPPFKIPDDISMLTDRFNQIIEGSKSAVDRIRKVESLKEDVIDALLYYKSQIATEESNTTLLPFDLGLAAQGHKVVTRDGRSAKIVADNITGDYPILAVVTSLDGDTGYASFTIKGNRALSGRDTELDLFILKEPETLEIQIWRDKNDRSYLLTTPNQSGYSKYYEADCELIKTITVTI